MSELEMQENILAEEESVEMEDGYTEEIPEAFQKLAELLGQDQFELLFPDKDVENQDEIRLVYLMNDAVESFLVFSGARMTGHYQKDYEGELDATLSQEDGEYVLIVYQGETVVTIFFQDLQLEVNLYNYGDVGHFWVKGYEYLRILEYRLAILRDKCEYLGEEAASEAEQRLASLVHFPPLNYACYPAVPEKYIVPMEDPWSPARRGNRCDGRACQRSRGLESVKVAAYLPEVLWKKDEQMDCRIAASCETCGSCRVVG